MWQREISSWSGDRHHDVDGAIANGLDSIGVTLAMETGQNLQMQVPLYRGFRRRTSESALAKFVGFKYS